MRRAGPEQRVPQDKVFALKSFAYRILLSAPQHLPELRFALTMRSLFSLMDQKQKHMLSFFYFW